MGYLKTIDIKSDMPDLKSSLERLEGGIALSARMRGGAVKVIHGYGSTGAGGKIRRGVRRRLDELAKTGKIAGYIPGESFSIFDETTRSAFAVCPELRGDGDLDRYNNGVTIVILQG